MPNIRELYFSNVKGDLMGGLTAGIVALPLALAFGVASGMGAAAGLYGAIIVGILAAIFGGTPAQVSGPTGPMTVVAAGFIAAHTGDPSLIFMAVALAGIFQIGLGLLRVGDYIKFIPYPVISGFMSGIGVIIILLQVNPFFGLASEAKITSAIRGIPAALASMDPTAAALGVLSLALVYLGPKVIRGVPGPLIAIVIGTALAVALKLDVPVIGEIPQGLPALHLPNWDLGAWRAVIVPALVLAVLGAIDSLLTSLVADNITKTRHNSNQELVGQGIGNAVAGMFGGLPGAGATMRTVVNVKAGGRQRLSGAIHGLVLLAALVGLGALASKIPLAVLAGILVTVGIGIIDYKGVRHALRAPRGDTAIMLVVLGMTVFVDLMQAVAIGLIMAAMLLVKRLSDMFGPSTMPLEELRLPAEHVPSELANKVFLYHLEGPLFFGTSRQFSQSLDEIGDYQAIIFSFRDVPFLDQSAAYALEDAIESLKKRGLVVYVSGLREQPARVLESLNVIPGRVEAAHVRPSVEDAVKALVAERPDLGSPG